MLLLRNVHLLFHWRVLNWVVCLTSNNHHYWENHELAKYVVVDQNDDVIKIHEKIELCLQNRELILQLYKDWKREYDMKAKQSVQDFLRTE